MIQIVQPKSAIYNKVQDSYKQYTKNMDCIYDIKLKKGTCIPDTLTKRIIKALKK